MKFSVVIMVSLYLFSVIGCSKSAPDVRKPDTTDSIPTKDTSVVVHPPDTSHPVQNAKFNIYQNMVFSSLKYNDANQYFSTRDTSFHGPRSKFSLSAAQMANVDLLYIYDSDYDDHGFMSPYTAGHEWYWNNEYYFYPWLSASHETIFLDASDLTSDDLNKMIANPSLFDGMYKNFYPVATNYIFPEGTCIGGRSVSLKKGQVFGLLFDNGKRGFLLIRPDQEYGWPDFPITGFHTKVDLIVER